jgi:hypothetical protein
MPWAKVAAAAVAAGLAAPAAVAAASPAGAAAAARCTSGQVLAWIGLSGRPGTSRGVAVPLEFTNASAMTCTLTGYPGVIAAGAGGRAAGPAAGHQPGTRPHLTVLLPGQTGHAVLTIGVARSGCRKPATALVVRIRPPGTGAAQQIGLRFSLCARRRTMVVSPVSQGVGVPR